MRSAPSLTAQEEQAQMQRHPLARIFAVFVWALPVVSTVLALFSFGSLKPRPTIVAVNHFHEINHAPHPPDCPLSRDQHSGGMLRFDVLNFADESFNIKELHVSKLANDKVMCVTSSGGTRPSQEELNMKLHKREGVTVDGTDYYFGPPTGITLNGQNALHLDFYLTESQCRQGNCADKYNDAVSSLNLESPTLSKDQINYVNLNLTDLLRQRYWFDKWLRVFMGWASLLLVAAVVTYIWLKTDLYRHTY